MFSSRWPTSSAELLSGSCATSSTWVMACGKPPGAEQLSQLALSPPPPGWVLDADPYLVGEQPKLVWRLEEGRRTVRLYRAAAYFGEDASRATCAEAWERLEGALRGRYGTPAAGTPGTTGRWLLGNTWGRAGRWWPTLGPELAQLIRESSPQGRFELYPAAAAGGSRLYKYDARLAYVALAQQCELPVGEPQLVSRFTGDQWAPSRWHVVFQAPSRWHGVGRVSVPGTDGLEWPTKGRHVTWVDGCELMALRQAGWRVTDVLQGIVWPERKRVLGPWATAIGAEYDAARSSPHLSTEVRRALLEAWRAICLHAIGALQGNPHRTLKRSPTEPPPEVKGANPVTRDAEGAPAPGTEWWWWEDTPAAMPELSHPEWSSHLWARMRWRMLEQLDDVPPRQLVAAVQDAVYTTEPQRDWHDTGAVGCFREAGEWHQWPPLGSLPELYAFAGDE